MIEDTAISNCASATSSPVFVACTTIFFPTSAVSMNVNSKHEQHAGAELDTEAKP